MNEQNFLKDAASLIQNITEAKSDSFVELAKVAGIDVKKDLVGQDLSKLDFSGANLSGADLRAVNFSGANLSGADLSHANLQNAQLKNTNLRQANLIGTDLRGVNTENADVENAIWNQSTSFDIHSWKKFRSRAVDERERETFTTARETNSNRHLSARQEERSPFSFEKEASLRNVKLADSSITSNFDWEQLRQLSDEDKEFEFELLSLCLNDVANSIEYLGQAITEQRFKDVKEGTSSLRVASTNVGAIRLSY